MPKSKPMSEREAQLARWAMDSAKAMCCGIDDFYIEVRLKKLDKGGGMAIEQLHPYRHAKLDIDPGTLDDVYFTRLCLAHELGHLICNDVCEAADRAGAEAVIRNPIEIVCDRIAVLAVGRIEPAPKDPDLAH